MTMVVVVVVVVGGGDCSSGDDNFEVEALTLDFSSEVVVHTVWLSPQPGLRNSYAGMPESYVL